QDPALGATGRTATNSHRQSMPYSPFDPPINYITVSSQEQLWVTPMLSFKHQFKSDLLKGNCLRIQFSRVGLESDHFFQRLLIVCSVRMIHPEPSLSFTDVLIDSTDMFLHTVFFL